MESKIVSLCVMNTNGDVAVGLEPVRVPHEVAQRLRLGDLMSVNEPQALARSDRGFGGSARQHDGDEQARLAQFNQAFGLSGSAQHSNALPLGEQVVRPEAKCQCGPGRMCTQCVATLREPPAFGSVDGLYTEVGLAYCKGFTYQYAYLKGARPEDACRWSHIDETEVREELWDIEPGDIVYDIGSAFGSYALTALAMGAAHVVCFNPNPQEQDLLMASARLNGWGDKVTRHNVGLWSESGYLNDEEQTFTKESGDFKVTKTADGRHTQLFEVRSLDSIDTLANYKQTTRVGRSVCKVDCEGAEVEILKGASMFFAMTHLAFVLIEVHVFKDASLEQQTDAAMAELGYVPVTKRPYHSVMHALYRMKGWDD